MTEVLTMTEYAKRVGVSRQRIGQYKAEGRLNGCFTMQGRTCWIDVEKADKAINGTVDPAQPGRKARPPQSVKERHPKWWREFSDHMHAMLELSQRLEEPERSWLHGRLAGTIGNLCLSPDKW